MHWQPVKTGYFTWTAICIAFLIEAAMLWLIHFCSLQPIKKINPLLEETFFEATLLGPPASNKLMGSKTVTSIERSINLNTRANVLSSNSTSPVGSGEIMNQVEYSKTTHAETHGPIAYYTPKPKIPQHLLTQDIQTFIVIEFFIHLDGTTQAKIARSAGLFELDHLALETVKTWKFHPARKNNEPIASKFKVRIEFEVK